MRHYTDDFKTECRSCNDAMDTRCRPDSLDIETRDGPDGGPVYVVSGYVARYGTESTDLGGFKEVLEKGAFRKVVASNPDVVALFNHDRNQVIGRTTSKTLRLREDDQGLWMECDLPPTAFGRNLYELIKRGDIKGQSFTFRAAPRSVKWSADFTKRSVGEVEVLRDVGPVTFPAYQSTDVASRSREEAMSSQNRRSEDHPERPEGSDTPRGDTQTKKGTVDMTIQERRKQAAQLLERAEAIRERAKTETRDMTQDELAEVSRFMDESEQHTQQADAEQRLENLSARAATPVERRSEPTKGVTSRVEVVTGHSRHFIPSLFGTVAEARQAAYRSGRWAMAALFGHLPSREWCLSNGLDFRAQEGSINAKGGYLVPAELETALVNLAEADGVARANCRLVRMGSDTKTVPVRVSGLKAFPVGERAAITESDKVWKPAQLVANKWGVLVRYSSEISEDAVISIADDLTQEAAIAFATSEDDALFNGDGTQAFHGIEGILSRLQAGSVETTAAGNTTLAKVTDADITKVIGLLPKYAQRGAKIFCTNAVKGAVFDRLLRGAGGNRQDEIAGSLLTTYAGLPIVTSPEIPTTHGGGKIVAFIGDMTQTAVFGDRRQFTMRSSDERYIESDESVLVATERFDINVFGTGDATKNGSLIRLNLV